MSDSEAMLKRIRMALGRSAEGTPSAHATRPLCEPDLSGVMPPIAFGELLGRFEAELQKVSGSTYRVSKPAALEGVLRRILDSSQATGIVLSRNPLLAKLGIGEKLRAWGKSVAEWPQVGATGEGIDRTAFRELAAASFSATVGITGVDFALAETGSLVLSSVTEGSQLASLAPPVHVALYRQSQLVASLEETLENLPVSRDQTRPSPGRSVVFITGTSRTADIEQILVRGVHGPREVHAILVEDSCL